MKNLYLLILITFLSKNVFGQTPVIPLSFAEENGRMKVTLTTFPPTDWQWQRADYPLEGNESQWNYDGLKYKDLNGNFVSLTAQNAEDNNFATIYVEEIGNYRYIASYDIGITYQEVGFFPHITPIINSENPVLCGTNTSTILKTSLRPAEMPYVQDVGGNRYKTIFQWKYASTEFGTYTNVGSNLSRHLATNVGFYKLEITYNTYALIGSWPYTESLSGSATKTSAAFQVTNVPTATITNSSGNTNDVILQAGQTENLKVNLTGVGPWTFGLSTNNSTKYYSSNTNLVNIPVSPTFASRYSIQQTSNNCGITNFSSSSVLVKINPEPVSITLPIPANTSVCKNSTLEIPYTLNGNWPPSAIIYLYLYGSGGSAYNGTCYNGTCKINVPTSFTVGTYTYGIGSQYPNYNIIGSQAITVVENTASCPIRQAFIIGQQSCSFAYLQANNRGEAGFTYKWYKDGNLLTGYTGDNYGISENGSYTLNIQNATTGYNQTSLPYIINSLTGIKPIISTADLICGNNTTVTLSSNLVNSEYTYQWFRTNSNYVTLPIAGATNSTLTTGELSNYSLKVRVSENCEYSSNNFTLPTTRTATLTNASFNNNDVNIDAVGRTDLNVTYNGSGPIELWLLGGGSFRKYIATSSPFTIPVTPSVSTSYSLVTLNYNNNCEVGLNTVGSVLINVGTPTITFPTPPTATVCAGSTIEIPYTTSGNWGNNGSVSLYLTTQTNTFISGTSFSSYNNPIQFQIPSTVPVGTYKLNVSSSSPYLPNQVPYNIDVIANTAACPAPVATLEGSSQSCGSAYLRAYPQGTGYNYQWFRVCFGIS